MSDARAGAGDLQARYQAQGYVVIEQLIPADEALVLKERCQQIRRAVRQQAAASGEAGGDDPSGVYVGLAARDEAFRQLAKDARLVEPLAQLIGPGVTFLSDKYVYKDHGTGFGSPWHQDWPYWRGSHKISIWIALDPATRENGCLRVVPGSHKEAVEHGRPDEESDAAGFGHRLQDVPEETVVDVPLPRGGAIFFHDLMLHASHPNRSGRDRWSVISTYVNTGDAANDPEYAWAVAKMEVHA